MEQPRRIHQCSRTGSLSSDSYELSIFFFEEMNIVCTVTQYEHDRADSYSVHSVGGTEQGRLEVTEFFKKRLS